MRLFIFSILSFLCLQAENITVLGIGRMGLCMALCLEKAGYNVLGVDLFPEYVDQLNQKKFVSFEPGVNESLRAASHFRATNILDEGLQFSDLYLIAVPTNPSTIVGEYDYSQLNDLLSKINERKVENKHIVIVSTVSPTYTNTVAGPLLKDCKNVNLSYSPMFIAQGNILQGIQYPELVLIGSNSKEKGDELEALYRRMCLNSPPFAKVSPESAEITKLALNCFVTMKIAFANCVSDIADATAGADKKAILQALGQDGRIGSKCLFSGYGFGGPCFPRDNRAFGKYAEKVAIDPALFRATDRVNALHAEFMANQFLEMELGVYLFEDVCYKSKCPVPIIEESQKLLVAKKIADAGRRVIIQDRREVIHLVESVYGNLFEYRIEP